MVLLKATYTSNEGVWIADYQQLFSLVDDAEDLSRSPEMRLVEKFHMYTSANIRTFVRTYVSTYVRTYVCTYVLSFALTIDRGKAHLTLAMDNKG